ncbi:43948_t:CDS:1, partial [Gigaspora margarita]
GNTSNNLEYCNTGRMNNARCYNNKIRQKDSSIIRNLITMIGHITFDMKSKGAKS